MPSRKRLRLTRSALHGQQSRQQRHGAQAQDLPGHGSQRHVDEHASPVSSHDQLTNGNQ